MSKAKVKCAECGFLAVRMTLTGEFAEVEEGPREKWVMPEKLPEKDLSGRDLLSGRALSGVLVHENTPRCFRRAYPLQGEVSFVYDGERGLIEAVQATIHKERQCPSFKKWEQGYSPKDHQDMINERDLRTRERLWAIALLVTGAILGALIRGA